MRKIILLTLSIFISTIFVSAQTKEQTAAYEFVFKKDRVFWNKKDADCCDLLYVDGIPYRTLKANDLKIAFSVEQFQNYQVMNVYVQNNSDKRITVRPEDAWLATWKKSADVGLVMSTVIKPTEASKIADKLESRQRWANALSVFGASMATQSATVTDNRTGQSATVTAPNSQAQTTAQNQARANSAHTTSLGGRIIADAFKANTLFKGDSTFGNIYFKTKKHETGLFILTIEGIEYGFVYSIGKDNSK